MEESELSYLSGMFYSQLVGRRRILTERSLLIEYVKLNLSACNARRNKNTDITEYSIMLSVALRLLYAHRRVIIHFQGGNHSSKGND